MTTNELYHHGILGMKWGVRRFQNEDGSLTEEGKRRRGLADKILKKKEPLTEEEKAEEKDKLIRTGTATQIAKYMKNNKGELNNEDLKAITTRLGYEQKVSEISQKEIEASSNWAKIDKLTKQMKTVNDLWTQGNNTLTNFTNTATNVNKIGKMFGKKKEADKMDKVVKALKDMSEASTKASTRVSDAIDRVAEANDKNGDRTAPAETPKSEPAKVEKTEKAAPAKKESSDTISADIDLARYNARVSPRISRTPVGDLDKYFTNSRTGKIQNGNASVADLDKYFRTSKASGNDWQKATEHVLTSDKLGETRVSDLMNDRVGNLERFFPNKRR